jgi:hypothetical protein
MALHITCSYRYRTYVWRYFRIISLRYFHVLYRRAAFPTNRKRILNEFFIHFWIFDNFSLPCPLQAQYQEEEREHGGALQA